jgi:2-oxoglutarate dehydrogenase E1 component
MLRRQAIRPTRKPLIAMTPKSLLRHKLAVSSLEDLCDGTFQNVIGETPDLDVKKVDRLVLCSGKVYYDLIEAREEAGLENVALVRIEQLYPFPQKAFAEEFSRYPKLDRVVWCQEEPMNQGAWYAIQHHLRRVMKRDAPGLPLQYAGRTAFAAPAVGYASVHIEQQQKLVQSALVGETSDDEDSGK